MQAVSIKSTVVDYHTVTPEESPLHENMSTDYFFLGREISMEFFAIQISTMKVYIRYISPEVTVTIYWTKLLWSINVNGNLGEKAVSPEVYEVTLNYYLLFCQFV